MYPFHQSAVYAWVCLPSGGGQLPSILLGSFSGELDPLCFESLSCVSDFRGRHGAVKGVEARAVLRSSVSQAQGSLGHSPSLPIYASPPSAVHASLVSWDDPHGRGSAEQVEGR